MDSGTSRMRDDLRKLFAQKLAVVCKFQRELTRGRVNPNAIGSRQRVKKLACRVPHKHRILHIEMLIIEYHGDKALRQRSGNGLLHGWIGGSIWVGACRGRNYMRFRSLHAKRRDYLRLAIVG